VFQNLASIPCAFAQVQVRHAMCTYYTGVEPKLGEEMFTRLEEGEKEGPASAAILKI